MELLLASAAASESEKTWMGKWTGNYSLLADMLDVVIRTFSPIGCSAFGHFMPSINVRHLGSDDETELQARIVTGIENVVVRQGQNMTAALRTSMGEAELTA